MADDAEPERRTGPDVLLLVVGLPFTLAEGRRDDGHRLVLLASQVREQARLQQVDGLEHGRDGPALAERRRRRFEGGHPRCDRVVVAIHLVEERPRRRVRGPDARPEPAILALVVLVQERHEPQQLVAHGGAPGGGESVLDGEDLPCAT